MPSADFWSHKLSYSSRPAFLAKLYSRVRFQISPNMGRLESIHRSKTRDLSLCPSSRSTCTPSSGSVSWSAAHCWLMDRSATGQEHRPQTRVSVLSPVQAPRGPGRSAARRCPATILCWLTDPLRRLPLARSVTSPQVPSPRTILDELSIWYHDSRQRNRN